MVVAHGRSEGLIRWWDGVGGRLDSLRGEAERKG